MTTNPESDQTVTEPYVIQASETTETELILKGLDAVQSVIITDTAVQERGIGIVQFLVRIESLQSADIEAEIGDIRSLAILTTRAEVDHKLNTDRV